MPSYDGHIPVQRLRGLQLEMVCLARYSVYLHFADNRAMLTTTLESIFDSERGVRQNTSAVMILQDLIGRVIEEAYEEHGPDLLMLFSGGKQLFVRAINENTESYTLSLEGEEFIR